MIPVLIALNVLAAVLPAAGIVRLLIRARWSLRQVEARVAERGHGVPTLGDLNLLIPNDIRDAARREVREVWCDVALVGGGLALGAVANIWGLFVHA